MESPVECIENYFHHLLVERTLSAIHEERVEATKVNAEEARDPFTVSQMRIGQSLAKDLAALLVLAGLTNGESICVGGRYYALTCNANVDSNPGARAQGASIVYGAYDLGTNTDCFGGETEQFLRDFPALFGSFTTKAEHQIIVDRYQTGLYLSFFATAIKATQTEVTTMLTRVAIPVVCVGVARAVLGTVVAVTTPLGWTLTGILAAAGLFTMIRSIHNGLKNIRKERTLVEEMDRSLGLTRGDSVEFLMRESDQLRKNCVHTFGTAKRLHTFVTLAMEDLAKGHEMSNVPAISQGATVHEREVA